MLQLSKASVIPIYLQIAQGLIREIRRGVIQPGTKLPGTRALAEALEIHRKTVMAAFDELYAQGWIESFPSRGTFVSRVLPEVSPQKLAQKPQLPLLFPSQTGFAFKTNPTIN